MKNLAQRLTDAGISVSVYQGKVSLVKEDDAGKEVKAKEFKGKGWLDEHPEGSDRGGYVPYWKCGNETAYFMENDGEWYEAD